MAADLLVTVRSQASRLPSEAGTAPLRNRSGARDPAANDKQILLSPNEEGHTILQQDTGPRLTVPGDTSGARYDHGVQVVTVFRSPTNL